MSYFRLCLLHFCMEFYFSCRNANGKDRRHFPIEDAEMPTEDDSVKTLTSFIHRWNKMYQSGGAGNVLYGLHSKIGFDLIS